MMIWYDVIICLCACRAVWHEEHYIFSFLFFSPCSHLSVLLLSLHFHTWFFYHLSLLAKFLHYLPAVFFFFFLLHHIHNEFGSVWGSKLLLTVASPTGCSHGAPNASLEYWINPTTTSVLSNQHRHYFLTITLHGGLVLWRMDGLWICCVVSEGRDNRHRQVEHLRLFYAIPFWLQSLPSQL